MAGRLSSQAGDAALLFSVGPPYRPWLSDNSAVMAARDPFHLRLPECARHCPQGPSDDDAQANEP